MASAPPSAPQNIPSTPNPRVALFVTCLVDLMRPQVGFAAIELLERAGCVVAVPETQTCCGQPAYNSGDRAGAKKIARRLIDTFGGFDYVVAPSGSCAGMIKLHVPDLFADEPDMRARAEALAARTFELTQFLTDVMGVRPDPGAGAEPRRALYHDSCSGLRELGIKAQPRTLLAGCGDLAVSDYSGSETCCGFGGTFCVKYPEISERIVSQRTGELRGAGGDLLLGGDLGCLLNIAGKLSREGSSVRVYHVAEALAGRLDGPGIGEANS